MSAERQNNSASLRGYRGGASSPFHQKGVLLPVAILGLVGTALTWWTPSLRIVSFLPPFFAVYALGHLLHPNVEQGPDVEAGFMSGYVYREKSDKRWHVIVAAGVIAMLNYFLVSFHWEG